MKIIEIELKRLFEKLSQARLHLVEAIGYSFLGEIFFSQIVSQCRTGVCVSPTVEIAACIYKYDNNNNNKIIILRTIAARMLRSKDTPDGCSPRMYQVKIKITL